MSPIGKCLREPGEFAIERAHELWLSDVIDPHRGDQRLIAVSSIAAIDGFIRGPSGLGWTGARKENGKLVAGSYRGNGDFAWCGAFAATCWASAGLRADLRKAYWSSTIRLYDWTRGTARRITRAEVRSGDVMIVKTSGKLPIHGDHIVLASDRANSATGWIPKIAGNDKSGVGPDGTKREGIVRGEISPADFLWAFRPLPEDLEAGP
ncbi:MAG: hypothetical protein ACEQSX_12865 [Baekduiaceae bacterium]